MASTELAIKEFPKIVEKYSTSIENKQLESIVESIDRLRGQNPAVYDEKTTARYLQDRAKALKGFVEEYFVASIANKFPLLSDELFDLKRNLTLMGRGNSWQVIRDDTEIEKYDAKQEQKEKIRKKRIQVPLFAYTPLFDGKHTATLGNFSETQGYRKITVNINAKLPGSIGQNLKNAYRGALSHYFGTLSEMFMNPIAGDIMYAERSTVSNKERVNTLAQPEIGAIWIPIPESL